MVENASFVLQLIYEQVLQLTVKLINELSFVARRGLSNLRFIFGSSWQLT